MTPYSFSLIFFACCAFLISVLIWLNRGDRVGRRYFVFSSFVSLWALGFAVMIGDGVAKGQALAWGTLAEMSAAFIPATWVHFVSNYPTTSVHSHKTVLVWLYGTAVICNGVAVVAPELYIRSVETALGFQHFLLPGPVFHLYTVSFIFGIPYGFWILIRKYKTLQGIEKVNVTGFIAATMVGFAGASPSFLPVYQIMVPQYGLLLLPIYPFIMAYFMMRRSLFDEAELVRAARRDKLAAIGTIATSINHEIRNPLYVIHGMAESFLHKAESPSADANWIKNESVAVIQKTAEQAKRAMDIMAQLSVFAKQKGGIEIQKEPVSIRECLERVFPLVNHEMTLDNIVLKNRLPENLPLITANARQIEEVLFNLIVNACQALKKTGGEIEISGRGQEKSVEVTIRDNGPGISRDQLKNIFEPFYTTKDEGTGLGLYIVRQLVERNDGHIRAESAGVGARFVLEFAL